ncbi:MAG: hypothetical protein LBK59_04050 [Bifidobacteriaceae bacterium]|jgi:hypothetical protein|nr:hypothetical protein [Bifidobacteriaceae bacterium]
MIRRLASLGLLAAIAAGAVVAVRRVERLRSAATPQGLARTADSLIGAAQGFAGDVRTAAARREAELRAAVLGGGKDDGAPAPAPGSAPRQPARAPSSSRPGGLQAGDELDPLYDF